MSHETLPQSYTDRCAGALYGMCIGDALAMPVHWYYDRFALSRDYGEVRSYMAPRNPHRDSILWRSSYVAPNKRGEILHDQAQYWGQRNVHYHQFLRAGENTLNVQLAKELLLLIHKRGGYDGDAWLERYVAFMTTPGSHSDTYLEEYHRHFFDCYARTGEAKRCAAPGEKHIGGLVNVVPLLAWYGREAGTARTLALEHLGLTHGGKLIRGAADAFADVLLPVLGGAALGDVLRERLAARESPFFEPPLVGWLDFDDVIVVERNLSTACYVQSSLPAVFYLALKYGHDPEQAMVVNTNLGGDNAGRGAVLGALLGAAYGVRGFPQDWVQGLIAPPETGGCEQESAKAAAADPAP